MLVTFIFFYCKQRERKMRMSKGAWGEAFLMAPVFLSNQRSDSEGNEDTEVSFEENFIQMFLSLFG